MLPDLSKSNFRKMDWGGEQRVRAQPRQPALPVRPRVRIVEGRTEAKRVGQWLGHVGSGEPGPRWDLGRQPAAGPGPAATKAAEEGDGGAAGRGHPPGNSGCGSTGC